jgi:hypothetical protein
MKVRAEALESRVALKMVLMRDKGVSALLSELRGLRQLEFTESNNFSTFYFDTIRC